MENEKSVAAPMAGTSVAVRPVRVRRAKASEASWDQILGPAGWVKVVVLAGLLGWLFWEDLKYMWGSWLNDPNWSHGFIIPLFSLYFLHQRREQLLRVGRSFTGINWAGLVLVVLAIFGYLVSIYPLRMGYPRLLALLVAIFGVVLFCCGWRVIQIAWLPIFYLFFAMPLPARLYEALTIQPRIWASQIAAAFLNVIPGMEASANGVAIEVIYKGVVSNLNVAEACAGMRLMMAFLALGVAMAYLSDRPYWHRIVLVLSTLPIALFCNFMRVIITGLLYVLVDPKFAKGGFHTLLGLFMLPVAFFLYWLIAGILNRLYEDVEVEEPAV